MKNISDDILETVTEVTKEIVAAVKKDTLDTLTENEWDQVTANLRRTIVDELKNIKPSAK